MKKLRRINHPDLVGSPTFRAWAERTQIVQQPRVREMLIALIDGADHGELAVRYKVTRARISGLWVRATSSFRSEPAIGNWTLADMPIERLYLPTRAENCLKYLGVATVGQLTRLKAFDLLREPNFGRHSLRAIQDALHAHGVGLTA